MKKTGWSILQIAFLITILLPITVSAQISTVPDLSGNNTEEAEKYVRSVFESRVYNTIDERIRILKDGVVESGLTDGTSLKSASAVNAVSANKEDSLILVELYNSTGGENWNDNAGWLTDSVCNWKGISLDADGRVTAIDLSSNNLTGQLPASVGDLTSLEYLYLHQNSLSGNIPAELGSLASLKALYLTGNGFSGSIPPETGSLTNLVWLGLGSNDLTGKIPDEIYQLVNLEFIDLSKNGLTGSISSDIKNLTALKAIYFEENALEGEIPKEIGGLSNLEQLALYRNGLTGPIPSELGMLTGLKQLYLHNNSFSGVLPDDLKNLTNLEYLYLSSNNLTGSFPEWIYGFTALKELFLADNDFTGQIPDGISKLKDLELLSLNYNGFSGEIPSEISELTNLQGLFLSDNEFEGSIPSQFGSLTNLKELWLSTNRLTGDVPSGIGDLTGVYRLLLSENGFTSLPDLSALALDSACFVQCNALDFGDLESAKINWQGIYEYSYDPQAVVPLSMTEEGDDIVFSVDVDGANNKYYWFREGLIIEGENESTLTINKAFTGEYQCVITNDDFPDLIMVSEKKVIEAYSVKFTVTDGSMPVEDAKVTLDGYSFRNTDADGIAVFLNVSPEDDLEYTVTKSGYADVSGYVSVVDADVQINVVMSVPTKTDDLEIMNLDIYPNPATEKIFINSKLPVDEIEFYNLTGNLLLKRSNIGKTGSVDVTSLKKGIYMVVIHTSAKVYTRKVILQ